MQCQAASKFRKINWIGIMLVTGGAALVLWFARSVWAQAPGQQTFPSAQAASEALASALQNNNEQALSKILGPDGKDALNSGDEVQDKADRDQCAQKYQEMHRLVTEPDGTTTLYIGTENWPFPFPLAQKNGSWYFDSEAGKNEVLNRTIGEDELTTIQVLHELADAENDYYKQSHNDRASDQYAQKIDSDPGSEDGLYWESSSDKPQSPIGPAVAAADADTPENAQQSESKEEPFQGYYLRILRGQGKDAQGGAEGYVDNGRMTRGFAILAYPAKYGSTGVMTFIVGKDGTVYEKDLGQNTDQAAKSITQYDPDSSWQKVE
jgi:hypothetical protein